MEYRFDDILEIKNGKNQKAVENPEGCYPIYGSGGVIGYANDYICEADTVIIGRKGSINNPIYVSEPFWNVDTAFGLSVKTDLVLLKYLYYFCKKFDFEKLNKTVTIPSLTKSDLLKIKITVPDKKEQQAIIDKLMKIESIIAHRKEELNCLDLLIKARFVEMFGEHYKNHVNEMQLNEICDFIDYRGKTPEKSMSGIPLITAKNVKDNRFSAEPQEFIPEDNYDEVMTRGIPKVNDVLFTTEAPLGNVCRIPDIYEKFCVGQRLITMQPYEGVINSEYLEHALASAEFQEKMWQKSSGSTVKGIRSKLLELLTIPVPPIESQNQFKNFLHQVDKSKLAVQKSLEKTQQLFDSLMQKYFG